MRAKVILSVAGVAVLVLLPALYFHFAPTSTTSALSVGTTVASPHSPPPAQPVASHQLATVRRAENPLPAPEIRADASAADRQDAIDERVSQLSDLATSNDPASLKTILSELNNQLPAIRTAALNAAVQFGSQDALPTLRQQLTWTEDPREKMAIQDAIDFLQLPSFDSVQDQIMAAQRAGEAQPAK